jgi:TPP-dependent trihydroxycyclohexane-1,2-dione (THcHDO) dehydratase
MDNALPQAIGAQASQPGRQVISLSGDGGLAMLLGELLTLHVRTVRHELALPPKLTFGQIKGFTLYATRTILSGGGEELVELARTNLRELAAD